MASPLTIAGMPTCAGSGNVTAESAFCLAPANTVRGFAALPSWVSTSSLDGRQLLLRVGIGIISGGAVNYTPSVRLYSGGNTGLTTFTNDTAIITPSAVSTATTQRLLTINAWLDWELDLTSAANSRLNGRYTLQYDSTLVTAGVTLTAGLTAGVSAPANIAFCLTSIFATNASNNAVLKYFEIDLI